MTTAQTREARAEAQAERNAKEELLDIILAILQSTGGRLAIAKGYVETATRQDIVVRHLDDRIIVMTVTEARKDPGRTDRSIFARILGRA